MGKIIYIKCLFEKILRLKEIKFLSPFHIFMFSFLLMLIADFKLTQNNSVT